MNSNLYYIALLLPKKINDEIALLQNQCAKKFNSQKALNSPPHITIIPPFSISLIKLQKIKIILNKINNELLPIHLKLDNFGSFSEKNIHIIIKKSKTLNNLYSHLCAKLNLLININEQLFIPHISIIHKDINLDNFLKADNYYKTQKLQKSFYSGKLYILKYCKEKNNWNVINE